MEKKIPFAQPVGIVHEDSQMPMATSQSLAMVLCSQANVHVNRLSRCAKELISG